MHNMMSVNKVANQGQLDDAWISISQFVQHSATHLTTLACTCLHLPTLAFTCRRLTTLEKIGKSAYNAAMPDFLSYLIERSKRAQVRACIFNKIG
jgi:hypothetical protein